MQTIETETNKTHLGIVNLYGFMETGSVFFVAIASATITSTTTTAAAAVIVILLLFYYCCS